MTTFTNFSGTTRLLLSDTARTASFDEIPLISLPPPSPNPTAATPPSLIAAIRDACTRVGFFYLADHGVPESTVDQAFEYARKFFDQTKDDKAEVHIRKSRTMRGWEPIKEPGSDDEVTGDRKRDPTRRADLKETFCWAYEESLDPEVVGKKRDADGKRERFLLFFSLPLPFSLFHSFCFYKALVWPRFYSWPLFICVCSTAPAL